MALLLILGRVHRPCHAYFFGLWVPFGEVEPGNKIEVFPPLLIESPLNHLEVLQEMLLGLLGLLFCDLVVRFPGRAQQNVVQVLEHILLLLSTHRFRHLARNLFAYQVYILGGFALIMRVGGLEIVNIEKVGSAFLGLVLEASQDLLLFD